MFEISDNIFHDIMISLSEPIETCNKFVMQTFFLSNDFDRAAECSGANTINCFNSYLIRRVCKQTINNELCCRRLDCVLGEAAKLVCAFSVANGKATGQTIVLSVSCNLQKHKCYPYCQFH